MNNSFGTSSFLTRQATYKYNKPPHYVDTFVGSQTDVYSSGSAYYSFGWQVEYTPGNPWTMTATIDADIGSNNLPITTGSAYITTNWGFHFNTTEKELLHTTVNGLNNGNGAWLNNILTQDKNALEYFIANPPINTSTSGVNTPATMSWTTANGYSGNSTSIAAAQVVWAMTRNGAKTIPIIQPVLRQSIIVPTGYNMTSWVSNLNRVYAKSSVQSENGVPTNFYNLMAQDTDPSSGTVQTDTGTNIPLIYGWLKTPPSIDQNGLNITITQDWVYGLYYQNIYGTRI